MENVDNAFSMRRAFGNAVGVALILATMSAVIVQASTWTFTPELRRLDAEGNELPAGTADVARHDNLRIGIHVRVATDGVAPLDDSHLGFELFAGAIRFFSDELGVADIGGVVRSLRGGQGWQRRVTNTTFEPVSDGWLGPPEEGEDETVWVAFWSDPTSAGTNRGAWCVPENGSCSIFLGVLSIPVASLPPDVAGPLSLRFGGVTSAEESVAVGAMHGRAEERPSLGNTVTYHICPDSGCRAGPKEVGEEDRRARALAMKFALAGVGREIGGNVVDIIGERTATDIAGPVDSYVVLGGRRLANRTSSEDENGLGWLGSALQMLGVDVNTGTGFATEAARATDSSSGTLGLDLLPTVRELRANSSFEFAFGSEDSAPGGWTLWGVSGDMDAFKGRPAEVLEMDGEVLAGHIGLDYRFDERTLAGVIFSRNVGDVGYRFTDGVGDDGVIDIRLISAHPYWHWSASHGLALWGSLGVGLGGAVLSDEKGAVETGVAMRMAAVGARRELARLGRFDVAVKADAFLVRMSADEHVNLPGVQTDTSRARMALQGSRTLEFGNGSHLTGSLEFGALADAGDAETGAGAELGGGIAYTHPGGLQIHAQGHMLLTHERDGFEQWGGSLSVTFDGGARGEGLFFALAPTWGAPAIGARGMWEAETMDDRLRTDGSQPGMEVDTRLGYGLNLPNGGGMLTLYSEMGQRDGVSPHLRVGTRIHRIGHGRRASDIEIYTERNGGGRGTECLYGIAIRARSRF